MSRLAELVAVVARLRGSEGCPWDRAQDFSTMRPYLLEEVYELLEAMDRVGAEGEAAAPALREELGDLLFVVLLLARVGEDAGWFSAEDAAEGIAAKMVLRHPHVFGGEAEAGLSPGSIAAWESRKARLGPDGQPRSRLAGVPATLPGLLRSHRQGEKAAAVGFDWPDHAAVLAKVYEELGELEQAIAEHSPRRGPAVAETGMPSAHPQVEHELGDVLMALASLGRHLGAPPEAALRRANDRFQARFEGMERLARAQGLSLDQLDDEGLDRLWVQSKQASP